MRLDSRRDAFSGNSPIAPAAFERERLIGRWGVASFHDEKDRRRTEAEARAQCGQAYAVSRGPTNAGR
ncbi:hypothetical protein [Microvirga terrestris]|uniref:Uncharacterized protein n=1 Tax=Microvirga terrestris TaxID=2791024 RepID=A0ABS0HWJ1_9HYPH|nr:hypothetical protein [Microvirga terrestris]MBF9197819.1 hypothetical protein [Microvirga terrestris]